MVRGAATDQRPITGQVRLLWIDRDRQRCTCRGTRPLT